MAAALSNCLLHTFMCSDAQHALLGMLEFHLMAQQMPEQQHGLQASVMERKLFTIPSFKIYGGVAGFFDFGPPGCAVKQNITQLWRQHFILEEAMLEVCCHAIVFP